jgi:hypothetical protein
LLLATVILFLIHPIGDFYDRINGPSFPEKKAWARDFAEDLVMRRENLAAFLKDIEKSSLPVKVMDTGYQKSKSLYLFSSTPPPHGYNKFGILSVFFDSEKAGFVVFVSEGNGLRSAVRANGSQVVDFTSQYTPDASSKTFLIVLPTP